MPLKRAQDPVTDLYSRDFLSRLLAGAALGAAGGASLRGLVGLYNMFRRNLFRPAPMTQVVDVPYRYPVVLSSEESEKKREKKAQSPTRANSPFFMTPAERIWNRISRGAVDVVKATAAAMAAPLAAEMRTTSLWSQPWMLPALLATGGLAAYGGWKLSDLLADKMRRSRLREEEEDVKREFYKTLMKSSSDAQSGLGTDLDALHDALVERLRASGRALPDLREKRAVTLGDILGSTAAMYLLAALGLGGAGLYAGYNWARKRQEPVVLEAATSQLRRKSLLRQPPIFRFRPVPEYITSEEEQNRQKKREQELAALND